MKKTPTIFLRDFDNNPKFVTPNMNPICDWVFAGQGRATRKYDGTCCMFDGVNWYKRREVKLGKPTPIDFLEMSHDLTTGKKMGWLPVSDADIWHKEAIDLASDLDSGTYELCGPKVQGNPEGLNRHVMISHATAELLDAPRCFEALKAWLQNISFEGIVFHHADGRMAKIKRRDFNFED